MAGNPGFPCCVLLLLKTHKSVKKVTLISPSGGPTLFLTSKPTASRLLKLTSMSGTKTCKGVVKENKMTIFEIWGEGEACSIK